MICKTWTESRFCKTWTESIICFSSPVRSGPCFTTCQQYELTKQLTRTKASKIKDKQGDNYNI